MQQQQHSTHTSPTLEKKNPRPKRTEFFPGWAREFQATTYTQQHIHSNAKGGGGGAGGGGLCLSLQYIWQKGNPQQRTTAGLTGTPVHPTTTSIAHTKQKRLLVSSSTIRSLAPSSNRFADALLPAPERPKPHPLAPPRAPLLLPAGSPTGSPTGWFPSGSLGAARWETA